MSECYTSADWHVKEGNEDRFVEAWTDFLQWTRKDHAGLVRAQLIREEADSKHFVSFAQWADPSARAAWRASPEFQANLFKCRDMCDQFAGLDYTPSVTI